MTSTNPPVLPTVNDPKRTISTAPSAAAPARGPKRTTKAAQKLQVLPDTPEPITQSQVLDDARRQRELGEPDSEHLPEESSPNEDEFEVYQQIAQIPEGTARADALRLNKKTIKLLPRVTAHCTASTYNFDQILKFLKARKVTYETDARLLDDVIFTTYTYKNVPQKHKKQRSSSQGSRSRPSSPSMGDLLGLGEGENDRHEERRSRLSRAGKGKLWDLTEEVTDLAEVFIFKYGTIVIWGMTEEEEQRFLTSIKRFAEEALPSSEIQLEDLHFYYASYSRIFNDVITLRKGSSYMTKLSLSHALAQSAKISLFEDRIAATIQQTKDIPAMIAESGTITMPHEEIMKHIGKVFLLRMSVNHVGSILDAPEIFWKFPDLQPLYDAAREYLELPQRLEVLNSRVDVLQDMLKLLKESVTSRHSERLEQIVIALIAVEIILGLMTIAVDLFSPGLEAALMQ